jgi:hypothetical protein
MPVYKVLLTMHGHSGSSWEYVVSILPATVQDDILNGASWMNMGQEELTGSHVPITSSGWCYQSSTQMPVALGGLRPTIRRAVTKSDLLISELKDDWMSAIFAVLWLHSAPLPMCEHTVVHWHLMGCSAMVDRGSNKEHLHQACNSNGMCSAW